jgi:hypothetical protein
MAGRAKHSPASGPTRACAWARASAHRLDVSAETRARPWAIGGVRDRARRRLGGWPVNDGDDEEMGIGPAVGRARRRPLRSRSDLAALDEVGATEVLRRHRRFMRHRRVGVLLGDDRERRRFRKRRRQPRRRRSSAMARGPPGPAERSSPTRSRSTRCRNDEALPGIHLGQRLSPIAGRTSITRRSCTCIGKVRRRPSRRRCPRQQSRVLQCMEGDSDTATFKRAMARTAPEVDGQGRR